MRRRGTIANFPRITVMFIVLASMFAALIGTVDVALALRLTDQSTVPLNITNQCSVPNSNLRSAMTLAGVPQANQVIWYDAVAPDDLRFWAVVTSDNVTNGPVEVWVTQDGGVSWVCTNLVGATGGA